MEFTPEQIAALLEALGLPPDTTDAQLVVDTAVDLAAQVESLDPAKPSSVAAAAARNGMEVLDNQTVAALRRDAENGRQLAAAATRQRIEAAVDKAIDRGAVALSRRSAWVDMITADPVMEQKLAATPDGLVVGLTETGHAADKGTNTGGPEWVWP